MYIVKVVVLSNQDVIYKSIPKTIKHTSVFISEDEVEKLLHRCISEIS